jgi:hypothetical protein
LAHNCLFMVNVRAISNGNRFILIKEQRTRIKDK